MRSGACARLWPSAALALVAMAATGSEAAWAQAGAGADYPAKPIRMIVGFAGSIPTSDVIKAANLKFE
jgi:hypothetical protein